MTATERAVTFICHTEGASIPDDVRDLGRRALLDAIGVTLAGTAEPPAALARACNVSTGRAVSRLVSSCLPSTSDPA